MAKGVRRGEQDGEKVTFVAPVMDWCWIVMMELDELVGPHGVEGLENGL